VQHQTLLRLGQLANFGRLPTVSGMQHRPGLQVRCFSRGHHESARGISNSLQNEFTLGPACVLQNQYIAGSAVGQPVPRHRNQHHAGFGRVGRLLSRRQPRPRRGDDLTESVSLRT